MRTPATATGSEGSRRARRGSAPGRGGTLGLQATAASIASTIISTRMLLLSRLQLEAAIRQQSIAPASPKNRFAEESRHPHQEAGHILERHKVPALAGERVPQDPLRCGPCRSATESSGDD